MSNKFIFRSNQSIGAAQAELDEHYLSHCFIETGDLGVITDCTDPRRIIAGRTGMGKSALIARLLDIHEDVIQIKPESLSLTYIANSGVIGFFTEAGVKMDIFYRLLWRHIFVVEVLKARFHLENEAAKNRFLNFIWQIIPKKKNHEAALEYLKKWGESFWKETEYRIHEVTSTLERELEGSVKGVIPKWGELNASAARKLTEEQKQEVIQRAQEIVAQVQIAELSRVIELLDEVLLTDRQKRYYIVIDKLDEDWVEDKLRFRLIRALIETSLDFAKIKNVKIIFAIRNDLLERVYRYTRDAGFQEEKYHSSTLQLRWTRVRLAELLDSRINLLVRDQYTTKTVTHSDVLPNKVGKQKVIDYILDRTLLRPRDVIQFFNTCIKQADGKPTISLNVLREAEGVYSRERLRALVDEWYGIYPNLFHLTTLLKRRCHIFTVEEILLSELEDNYLQLLVSGQGQKGLDLDLMNMIFEGSISLPAYRVSVILIFYKVGLIGLKVDSHVPTSWTDTGGVSVSEAEVTNETKIVIHKTFWRCLGISDTSTD